MTSREQGKVVLNERCLAVFVDETGHEALVKGQPVYGLGGCAALGRDLDRLIYQPWRDLRKRVTGSPDTRLHANSFPTIAAPGDFEAVAIFFRDQPFFRFGAIFTTETKVSTEISLMRAMKVVLEGRISDIAQRTLCREIKVIFEASDRTNKLIEEAFQDIEFYRGSKRIPSECGFMPKSVGDPALEVADFVMHAVGRQGRHNLQQRGSFVPDFCAVFHAVDPKLTSFLEVEAVIVGAPVNLPVGRSS
jgi:hypothetical protein